MSEKGLNKQSDIEDLVAWMDGELSGPEAERVARLVEADADWRAEFEQFRRTDRVMGLLAPAKPRRDLTDRIVRSVRRRRLVVRVVRAAVSLAAAACIILAVHAGRTPSGPTSTDQPVAVVGLEAEIAVILKDVPAEDRFIVRNLPLFRNYEDVTQYQQVRDLADAETLSALAALDNAEEM